MPVRLHRRSLRTKSSSCRALPRRGVGLRLRVRRLCLRLDRGDLRLGAHHLLDTRLREVYRLGLGHERLRLLQLSLNLLLVLVVGGFTLLYLAIRLIVRTLSLPAQVRVMRRRAPET